MNFLLFVSVQTPADIASYSGYEAKPQEDFFRSFEVRQRVRSVIGITPCGDNKK